MWEQLTGTANDKGNPNSDKVNLNGTVIADIGCGPGRFVDAARAKGARVIGIDYSAAVEVAEQNFKHNPDVCICQADGSSFYEAKTRDTNQSFGYRIIDRCTKYSRRRVDRKSTPAGNNKKKSPAKAYCNNRRSRNSILEKGTELAWGSSRLGRSSKQNTEALALVYNSNHPGT